MNLLTVSHRCLIHLMDYLYTEPFWGEVEKRPTKSCTLQNGVSKFRTQKIHRFPMEKKGSQMFKVDLLTFLLVGNHNERTIWHNIFVTFFPTIFGANTRMVSIKSSQKLDSSSVRSVGSKESSPQLSRENAGKPPFFQAQVFFFPISIFFSPEPNSF